MVRLNFMNSAQTAGEDKKHNVQTERRSWLQIYSHGFLIESQKCEYRFPCFAFAAENAGTYIING